NSEPRETVEDDLGMAFGAALAIGILDAEHHGSTGVAGVKPIEQRRARAPHMEVARRRGSETDAGLGHGCGSDGVSGGTEREGFEPSIEVYPLCRFSKPVPSATRPPLQQLRCKNLTES